jgi:hypothetical protein
MSIYALILCWALSGTLAALLALAARLKPAGWTRYGWLWLLMSGLCSSVSGGALGFWLLGRLFSIATATWIAILTLCLPGLFRSLRERHPGTHQPGERA